MTEILNMRTFTMHLEHVDLLVERLLCISSFVDGSDKAIVAPWDGIELALLEVAAQYNVVACETCSGWTFFERG